MRLMWPKVFTDPNFQYDMANKNVESIAVSDGLVGWANCHMETPPAHFGHGIAKCVAAAGLSHGSPKDFNAAADRLIMRGLKSITPDGGNDVRTA